MDCHQRCCGSTESYISHRSRKHEEYWQSICGQRQAESFLKTPTVQGAGELLHLSRNRIRVMTGLLTGHCHFRRCLFKLGLAGSSRCERYRQTSQTTNVMQHVAFVFITLCGSTLHVSGALCTHHQECI